MHPDVPPAAPDRPLLGIEGATVRFGGIVALDGIDLAVNAGEICGLIGPNGAGKTTLFNTVTRLYDLDAGAIRFEGRAIDTLPTRKVIGRGIARTFQNLGIYLQLTVLENVMLGAHHRLRHRLGGSLLRPFRADAEDARVADECLSILRTLGLHRIAGDAAGSLPYGVLKRVEIARALASRPRLLLLDEPAGGLTHGEVGEFGRMLVGIRESFGLTIVLVEHHMGLVMSACSRVVALHLGRKIAEGPPASVRADPQVVAAYLGRPA